MGSQTIELKQVLLGTRPYLLIEFDSDPEDPEGAVLSASSGGTAEPLFDGTNADLVLTLRDLADMIDEASTD